MFDLLIIVDFTNLSAEHHNECEIGMASAASICWCKLSRCCINKCSTTPSVIYKSADACVLQLCWNRSPLHKKAQA